MRLAVSGAGIPSAVRLVYMEDGKGEVRKDMPYIFDVGDHCIYSVNVKMPEKAGLIWYYFELETEKEERFITATIQNNSAELVKCVSKTRVDPFQITVYNEDYKTRIGLKPELHIRFL